MGASATRWQNEPEVVAAPIMIGGYAFLGDPSGALVHADERVLLVADLHLEKGSSFARRGMLLPPYDTGATLAALAEVIDRYKPRVVVAMGDSFHDRSGAARLSDRDRGILASMQRGRDWLWLAGNHDPIPPAGLDGDVQAEWAFGPLVLRHEPQAGAGQAEIAGHLHPVARVFSPSGVTRRRCFLSDGHRCVMPAFGAYAGGLNIHHAAFRPLFGTTQRTAYALGRDRVYAVSVDRCASDG